MEGLEAHTFTTGGVPQMVVHLLLPIAAPEDYLSPTILVFDGAQQCPKV